MWLIHVVKSIIFFPPETLELKEIVFTKADWRQLSFSVRKKITLAKCKVEGSCRWGNVLINKFSCYMLHYLYIFLFIIYFFYIKFSKAVFFFFFLTKKLCKFLEGLILILLLFMHCIQLIIVHKYYFWHFIVSERKIFIAKWCGPRAHWTCAYRSLCVGDGVALLSLS